MRWMAEGDKRDGLRVTHQAGTVNGLKVLSALNVDFKVKSHVGGLLPRFQGNPTHRTWAQLLVQALANAPSIFL